MNRKTKLLLCLALIASAMMLVTCKPIDPTAPSLIGIWFGTQGPTPSGGYFDVKFTIREDGTFESLLLDEGTDTIQSMSSRGTYTCSDNIVYAQNTEIYDGSNWVADSGTSQAQYSFSDNGNTLTLSINPSTTWTLTRL